MFETGMTTAKNDSDRHRRRASRKRLRRPARTLSGLASLVALFLCAPVSPDSVTGQISISTALAGNGDGNYGQGRGNGGANGDNPGNGGGNSGGVGAGGSAGGGGGGNDDPDDGTPDIPPVPSSGFDDHGNGSVGSDEAAELADEEFDQAIDAVGGPLLEGAPGDPAALGLPTVRELFSLGDEAVVPADEERRLIANGWKFED